VGAAEEGRLVDPYTQFSSGLAFKERALWRFRLLYTDTFACLVSTSTPSGLAE
jgi:hypothetical protein